MQLGFAIIGVIFVALVITTYIIDKVSDSLYRKAQTRKAKYEIKDSKQLREQMKDFEKRLLELEVKIKEKRYE